MTRNKAVVYLNELTKQFYKTFLPSIHCCIIFFIFNFDNAIRKLNLKSKLMLN